MEFWFCVFLFSVFLLFFIPQPAEYGAEELALDAVPTLGLVRECTRGLMCGLVSGSWEGESLAEQYLMEPSVNPDGVLPKVDTRCHHHVAAPG